MEKSLVEVLSECIEVLNRIDNRLKRLEELETKAVDGKTIPQDRLIPVTKWNNYHEWPPIGGLRHIIFWKDQNGADKFLRRSGKRILIHEKSFFEWMDSNKESVTPPILKKYPMKNNP